ncbi:hypothetical protein NU09_0257 [Flavobacterium beibuense]|uniref:Uncharacterized protein n=1 Tax=Flavobacterium beibuense TaxID=657326 RepID=A0A444WIQ0_9FLAO|nr:hypothetical protein NU09_0257 [Flavobacterium beibuense]
MNIFTKKKYAVIFSFITVLFNRIFSANYRFEVYPTYR